MPSLPSMALGSRRAGVCACACVARVPCVSLWPRFHYRGMPAYCDVLYFSARTNVRQTQMGCDVPMQLVLADGKVEHWHCCTVRVCPPKG